MNQDSSTDLFRSNIGIVEFAFKKWKTLLGVAIFAGIFGYIFSGPQFIEPEFKSEAILYPSNLGEYGDETGLEQIQQYLESNEIRAIIIDKFNLYDEYDIDKNAKSSKAYMNDAYAEHVRFNETRFESVNIEVFSTDPAKAKTMIDEIIDELNRNIRASHQEKYREQYVITNRFVNQKINQIDSIEAILTELSVKYGVLNYEAQSERVTEKYLDFLLSGKKGKEFDETKLLYENLQKYGVRFNSLYNRLELLNEEYVDRIEENDLIKRNLEKIQSYSYVIVSSEESDKKSSPIRWLIVASAIAAAVVFVFSLLLILGYQKN